MTQIIDEAMSSPPSVSALLVKWSIFTYLAAFLPLIFVTPVVGIYPNSGFLFVMGNIGLLLTPFLPIILGQIVVYAVLLYTASKYFAGRLLAAPNKSWWIYVVLASLLALDTMSVFSAGYHLSIFRQYLDFLG